MDDRSKHHVGHIFALATIVGALLKKQSDPENIIYMARIFNDMFADALCQMAMDMMPSTKDDEYYNIQKSIKDQAGAMYVYLEHIVKDVEF